MTGSDTIAALATARGESALAVVRLSGPLAVGVVASRFTNARLAEAPSHTAHVGWVTDARGQKLDQAVVYSGHGVVDVSDEVVLLLMHVLSLDFEQLNDRVDSAVSKQQVEQALTLMHKRITTRQPMAYVLGTSVFAGLSFTVDERVLVPRSPFVQLIDQAFQPWVNMSQVRQVLDLCTGSGCIGLAIAHYFDHCRVTLSDLSSDALAVAAVNQKALNLTARSQCVQSDLFDDLSGEYDLIVTNPPYVSEHEYQQLPEEFSHEPKMALVTERGGLEIPVRILSQAVDYLTDHGHLLLEVGFYDQALADAFPQVPFVWVDFGFEADEAGDGQGICVFTRSDLLRFKPHFDEFLNHVS